MGVTPLPCGQFRCPSWAPLSYFWQEPGRLVSGVGWTVLGMFKKLWKRRDQGLKAWVRGAPGPVIKKGGGIV